MNASDMARLLGRRGGRARAARLPESARKAIASQGGQARRASLEAARRIMSTLTYAAAAAELAGGHPPVARVKTATRTLPGLYHSRSPWPTPPTTSTKSRRSSRR